MDQKKCIISLKSQCSIDGCSRPVDSRGWCGLHYARWHRHGCPETKKYHKSKDLIDQAISSETNDCIDWAGAKIPSGYGHCRFNGRTIGAHRAVLIVKTNQDPDDKDAAHICHNKGCVNPRHLRWLSHSENMYESSWKWTTRSDADLCSKLKTEP